MDTEYQKNMSSTMIKIADAQIEIIHTLNVTPDQRGNLAMVIRCIEAFGLTEDENITVTAEVCRKWDESLAQLIKDRASFEKLYRTVKENY